MERDTIDLTQDTYEQSSRRSGPRFEALSNRGSARSHRKSQVSMGNSHSNLRKSIITDGSTQHDPIDLDDEGGVESTPPLHASATNQGQFSTSISPRAEAQRELKNGRHRYSQLASKRPSASALPVSKGALSIISIDDSEDDKVDHSAATLLATPPTHERIGQSTKSGQKAAPSPSKPRSDERQRFENSQALKYVPGIKIACSWVDIT